MNNNEFLKRRLFKIGLILFQCILAPTKLLGNENSLWQISGEEKLKDSPHSEANEWQVDVLPISIESHKTEHQASLGSSEILFSLEENPLQDSPLGHILNKPHSTQDRVEEGKEWLTEVDDPSLEFYPGMLPSHLTDENENTKQKELEDELRWLEQLKLLEQSREIAQVPPPAPPVITPPPQQIPPVIRQDQLQPTLTPSIPSELVPPVQSEVPAKTILINFNNVNIIEFIRFVSRISNKNFVFDENDLQFNVTIVSEDPTTVENIMTALIQTLRIHGLTLLEQGNNLVIHKNPGVKSISRVVMEDQAPSNDSSTEIVTQVYRLNTVDPERAAQVIKPLVSEKAIIEIIKNPNHLVITDIVSNINEITQLIKDLDSPKSGLVIGQYVVRNAFLDSLISLAQKIMAPIAQEQPLSFVPHAGANSIFIISSPYLVERSISILQYLDQFQGTTRILNPQEMSAQGVEGAAGATGTTGVGTTAGATGAAGTEGRLSRGGATQVIPGRWERDANGNWQYTPVLPPGTASSPTSPPAGKWLVDENGNWYFQAGAPGAGTAGLQGPGGEPEGKWILNPQGIWVFQLAAGRSLSAERISRSAKAAQELPTGHIERTQFYIHKLRYRKGEQIEKTLGRIAKSFEQTSSTNSDLISAIHSVQWIEGINSIVFSGTPAAIERMRELINEIDLPLRQVFIEMLILTGTLQDTMELGVDFGSRFGGGQGGGLVAGSQAFLTGASTLPVGLDTAGLVGTSAAGVTAIPGGNQVSIADASNLVRTSGRYALGLIGQSLHFNGTTFTSIGTLITAIHTKTKIDITMNPKLLAEDGTTAEIFVGENVQYPTQAVANDRGSIVTQNFQYQDIGTRLKITPFIASNDMITLDIEEEVSSVAQQATTIGNTNQLVGPTTNVSKSTMRVHVPNKYFVCISGLMSDQDTRFRNNVPCLGGVPLIGAAFSDTQNREEKQNTMVFIRPEIIDTESQINDLTKRQQDIYRIKSIQKKDWIYENQETLDWMNLKDTDWNSEDSSLE